MSCFLFQIIFDYIAYFGPARTCLCNLLCRGRYIFPSFPMLWLTPSGRVPSAGARPAKSVSTPALPTFANAFQCFLRNLERVTREEAGVGDVLHSVPSKRQRDRDRSARHRQSVQRQGGELSRKGKRNPALLVVRGDAQAIEETLKPKRGTDGGSGADLEDSRGARRRKN